MKVLYDHQIFSRAGYGGISKYFVELLLHLKSYEDFSYELTNKFSNNENLIGSGIGNSHAFFRNEKFKGKVKLINLINEFYTRFRVSKTSFDIFHPTYYDDYFLQFLPGKKPLVTTCYDLIHEKFGAKFPYLKKDIPQGKKKLFERSTQIIAISENTKNDIVYYYDIKPEKIKVIYLASDLTSIGLGSELISLLPKDYILFVGVRQGYKNFKFFINALAVVLKKYSEIKVVCAGGGEFSKDELQLFTQLGISKRIFYQEIQSHTLSPLYKNALAFFYPSLYEGFGIPILEAFSNSCPAVLSNQGSFPEIGKDAVLYFDPYDKESLINSAIEIIENKEKRIELKQKGLRRAKDFSWTKTAHETYGLYKTLI